MYIIYYCIYDNVIISNNYIFRTIIIYYYIYYNNTYCNNNNYIFLIYFRIIIICYYICTIIYYCIYDNIIISNNYIFPSNDKCNVFYLKFRSVSCIKFVERACQASQYGLTEPRNWKTTRAFSRVIACTTYLWLAFCELGAGEIMRKKQRFPVPRFSSQAPGLPSSSSSSSSCPLKTRASRSSNFHPLG